MPNPYYIPRAPSPLGAAVDTFTRLRTMKVNEDLARGKLDVERQRNELTGRRIESEEAIGTERNAIMQRQVDLQEKEQTAKGMAVAPMSPKDILPMQTFTAMMDQRLGTSIKKTSEPVFNLIRQMQGERKVDVYRALKQNWGTYSRPIAQQLEKDHEKAMMAGDVERAQGIAEMYDAIQKPEFLDRLMPSSAWFDFGEQAELKIKAANVKRQDQWGKPYFDEQTGTLMQDNLVTGQTKKVAAPTKGMEITTPDGTTIRTGVPTGGMAGDMSKPTRTKIEGKMLDAQEGLARLDEIAQSYRPEYLRLGTKWKTWSTNLKDKLADVPFVNQWVDTNVKPEDRQLLESFSAFKRDSIDNINRYIKEITGAQMSEREADRIRKGMPDPGEGLFDGDGPTQFEGKWTSTVKSLKTAAARYTYLLKSGLEAGQIQAMAKGDRLRGVDIEKIMRERRDEITAELKAADPSLPQSDINRAVMETLKDEFGL